MHSVNLRADEIMKKNNIPNRYILAILAAKRARQLSQDKSRMIEMGDNEKWLTEALKELDRQALSFELDVTGEEAIKIIDEALLVEEA